MEGISGNMGVQNIKKCTTRTGKATHVEICMRLCGDCIPLRRFNVDIFLLPVLCFTVGRRWCNELVVNQWRNAGGSDAR